MVAARFQAPIFSGQMAPRHRAGASRAASRELHFSIRRHPREFRLTSRGQTSTFPTVFARETGKRSVCPRVLYWSLWENVLQRCVALAACMASGALALDPRKSLTQYSRTIWTQERGLPQDTIRAITQTKDGYLWLGTDEGLARFDGYEFVVFNKTNGDLPDNSITALAAANDGGLWIGTSNGLTQYRDGRFQTFTVKQGLPDAAITALHADHEGALWVVAGVYLSRYQDGQFTNFKPDIDIPVSSARAVCEDANHDLWVAGFSRVVRRTRREVRDGDAGRSPGRHGGAHHDGRSRRQHLDRRKPGNHPPLRRRRHSASTACARDCPIRWCAPYGRIATAISGRAPTTGWRGSRATASSPRARTIPKTATGCAACLRIAKATSGLGPTAVSAGGATTSSWCMASPKGLPSDAPNAVFQDRAGRVWVGFNDLGMMLFSGSESRRYTTREGLPDSEIFQIREGLKGDLLIATRSGVARMQNGKFRTYHPPDPLARKGVFDAIEDAQGALWLATPAGLSVRPRQAVSERGRGRSAADRFRGHAVRGAGRRDLGGHLRQGPVAGEG